LTCEVSLWSARKKEATTDRPSALISSLPADFTCAADDTA
jgi:hypothetical protein